MRAEAHFQQMTAICLFPTPRLVRRRAGYRKEYRPTQVYATIETLLPDARCPCAPLTNTPRVHCGKLLELYVLCASILPHRHSSQSSIRMAQPNRAVGDSFIADRGRDQLVLADWVLLVQQPIIIMISCRHRWAPPGQTREGWVHIAQEESAA
jgi:hypothetical protein